jgi:hypothetical protein
MAFAQRQHLGALQETAHALGVFLLIHHSTLSFNAPVERQAKERTPIRASHDRYRVPSRRNKTRQRVRPLAIAMDGQAAADCDLNQ